MRIIIFGASDAGTSTLTDYLAAKNDFAHVEAGNYYWLKTERPFTKRRDPTERNNLIIKAITETKNVIVSGSIFNWVIFFEFI